MIGKNNLMHRTYVIFLYTWILIAPAISNASVYLRSASAETSDTLPSYLHLGNECVSLSHLCEHLGIAWQWDMYSERFTLFDKEDTISLIQGNNFYQVNDSTFQLPYPPLRSGGNLYLAVRDAADIFSRSKVGPVNWLEEDNVLTVAGKKSPETVVPEVKPEEKKTEEKKPKKSEKPAKKKEVTVQDTAVEAEAKDPKQKIKTIVIDPGHGGKDPGAIGPNGVKEKDVVLAVSLAMRDELEKNGNLKIFMTRSTDKFIPLRERTKFANKKNADLFISVHANSIAGSKKRKKYVRGYKVYFLSQAKNEDDKLAAMIENSVIELEENVQRMDYLQSVLTDMANNEFLTESQDLSILIAESFGASLKKVRALHTGVGQANFWVLNGAYMPSVLVEACFISNPVEEKMLINKKFQKKLGVAIGDAVVQFKKKYEAGL